MNDSAIGHAGPARPTAVPPAATSSADHRREILDAAARAFMERGYNATSIADIADRLGATKGRIYHWYRSKAQIYLDVHRRAMDMLFEVIEPIAREDAPAEDRLRRMVREHALLMMRELPYQRVSVQSLDMRRVNSGPMDLRELREGIIALRDCYEQLFADVIADGVAEGSLRPVRGRLATKPLLGAVNWITMWFDPDRTDTVEGTDEIAEGMATYAIQGLRKDRP